MFQKSGSELVIVLYYSTYWGIKLYFIGSLKWKLALRWFRSCLEVRNLTVKKRIIVLLLLL